VRRNLSPENVVIVSTPVIQKCANDDYQCCEQKDVSEAMGAKFGRVEPPTKTLFIVS
jgi:hypothetical protein